MALRKIVDIYKGEKFQVFNYRPADPWVEIQPWFDQLDHRELFRDHTDEYSPEECRIIKTIAYYYKEHYEKQHKEFELLGLNESFALSVAYSLYQ